MAPVATTNNSNTNQLAWKNAWSRQYQFILSCMAVYTVVYSILLYTFKDSKSILGLPSPAPEYCVHSKTKHCTRPDLFAFQATCAIPLFATAYLGMTTWRKYYPIIPQTTNGRLFFTIPAAERLLAINFSFQAWDFFVSFFIPEHCTPLMIGHHIMACAASASGMIGGIQGYYAIYFMGMTEISSVGLLFRDLATYFPPSSPNTAWFFFSQYIAGVFFVIFFIYYRVIRWWPVSYQLHTDAIAVIASGKMQKLRPNRNWTLYTLMVLNVPLGLLQLFWCSVILQGIKDTLSSGSNSEAGLNVTNVAL